MTSIRARTSTLVALSMASLLAVGGVALFMVVRTALTHQFDGGLSARAAALQSLTRLDADTIEMDIAGEVMPRFQPGADAEYFVAWVRDGAPWRLLERSESFGRGPGASEGAAWTTDPPAIGFADWPLPDGAPGRSLTIEFVPAPEFEGGQEHLEALPPAPMAPAPPVRLVVVRPRAPLDHTLATIGASIAGVGLLLVLASLGATRWAVRRGTSPLTDLSARVAQLGPDRLDHRLTYDHLPCELAPVADRLNALLERLHEAFAREKRFTGAASHELRTPIAELRMLLEVGLSQPRTPERWEQTARDGLQVLERAQRLTEALLALSRSRAGSPPPMPAEAADLAAILRDQADRVLACTGEEPARLLIDAPRTLPTRIDPTIAASILRNIIDNALRHGSTSPASPASCRAWTTSNETIVAVANHAPTLDRADVAHLTEPFWRKDASRHQHAGPGFGLGLAVSSELARAAGAHLTCTLGADHRLEVVLTIPN